MGVFSVDLNGEIKTSNFLLEDYEILDEIQMTSVNELQMCLIYVSWISAFRDIIAHMKLQDITKIPIACKHKATVATSGIKSFPS